MKIKKSQLSEEIRNMVISTLSEKKKDEEEDIDFIDDEAGDGGEEDIEGDIPNPEELESELGGGEEIDAPAPAAATGGEESTIQDSLKAAYDAAVALGDKKLAHQIGNSITFFTRTHIIKSEEL